MVLRLGCMEIKGASGCYFLSFAAGLLNALCLFLLIAFLMFSSGAAPPSSPSAAPPSPRLDEAAPLEIAGLHVPGSVSEAPVLVEAAQAREGEDRAGSTAGGGVEGEGRLVLPPGCEVPGPRPLIIGGQGGSGTRAIVELLNATGAVHLGPFHQPYWDNMPLFLSRLHHPAPEMIALLRASNGSLAYELEALPSEQREKMITRMCWFFDRMRKHVRGGPAALPGHRWGFKEPRNMYLLPLWRAAFGRGGFDFLHVVRDVRTIHSLHIEGKPAVQRAWFGDQKLAQILAKRNRAGIAPRGGGPGAPFVEMWATSQMDARRWMEAEMPRENYRIVRVEDFAGPLSATTRDEATKGLLEWVGVDVPEERVAAAKRVFRDDPKSLAHYDVHADANAKNRRFQDVVRLFAAPTLKAFGYPDP
mmetsp:Transcript_7736/g.25678  ORF Transcript_7736/g.25678 Transcript_7736/m.25678 type:complete len:417 (-) Transcript_7736:51-1301(-)